MLLITKDQYKAALVAEGVFAKGCTELVTILNDAPSCKATAGQIARLLGYQNLGGVNFLIGGLGKRIAKNLGIKLPDRLSTSPGWWRVVATGEVTNQGFAWSLRPELLEALVELDLLDGQASEIFPETVPAPGLLEGATRRVTVNAYERNWLARVLCIKHHGSTCKVCGLDFSKVYGLIGEGFIHVHHIVDICEIGELYQVDPVKDLVPVCPNCHAMLHSRRPAMLIHELRDILNSTRQNQAGGADLGGRSV